MKRILLLVLSLWVLLAGPGLCLAGVVEHPCADCREGAACGHEEGCTTDPCAEALTQPASRSNCLIQPQPMSTSPIVPGAELVTPVYRIVRCASVSRNIVNLPYPAEDLPLLI